LRPGLNRETHVTLILRWLCGLSPKEIGQAFLVDTQTIDRRLHRGRGRLRQLGRLPDVDDLPDIGPGGTPSCDRCTCCSARATTAATRRTRYARSCARTRCA
jgi:Predicted RNA polymerase sigma factor containing a TPR repeat domain